MEAPMAKVPRLERLSEPSAATKPKPAKKEKPEKKEEPKEKGNISESHEDTLSEKKPLPINQEASVTPKESDGMADTLVCSICCEIVHDCIR
jgi:hypothetical protein